MKLTANQTYSLALFAFISCTTVLAQIYHPAIYLLGAFTIFHVVCSCLALRYNYKTLVASYQSPGRHLPGWVDVLGYAQALFFLAVYQHPALYIPWALCFYVDLRARAASLGLENDWKTR